MNLALALVMSISLGFVARGETVGGQGSKSDGKPAVIRERVRGEWRKSGARVNGFLRKSEAVTQRAETQAPTDLA